MKINEFYDDSANINLNGSIAALVPAVIIVIGNLSLYKSQEIMLLTIPFLTYSFICFHFYLFRMKQSILIARNMVNGRHKSWNDSLFVARHLLVCYLNTHSPSILFYFPNGDLAGRITRYRRKGLSRLRHSKMYALYNSQDEAIGFFEVKGNRNIKIGTFDQERRYLGCFEKKKLTWRKSKKQLLDAVGKSIGAVEGSSIFMDEKVIHSGNQTDLRLRRGWMPVEWSTYFPEANTPVLSFWGTLSDKEKLLRMSFLINEYFIER
ncbi:hypothetical protein [Neobacillus vireti]|uniref:Uncharacterized protein n=1 Tax=Neobacillus vireti LMG 21834 TaxID=1131730 RepID=A0AB94ILG9_9BACI|nr:hypothetical protein [Neobacillus vireti]ETI67899.1 hypothetical protein BAVI_15461 [Neobacillus vireti LMG 21834]KLT17321.1 hypothetical protein AA980_15715 [Neobacillus vireti]